MKPLAGFEYQERGRFFGQIAEGMEELAALELSELGAVNIHATYRGLYFEGSREVLCRVNYHSRLLTRVLAPLKVFHCHDTAYLYRQVKGMEWSSLFSPDRTFAVMSSVSHSAVRHSRYAALCVKDGIADHFQERFGARPSVRKENPDLWVHLHLENNLATISLDTSGGSLHRRGYRTESVEAPMQETLAAAIVRLAEWDGSRNLHDPFCGSGTLLAEALMLHCRIPAAFLRRRFGFEYLPDFDKALWSRVKDEGIKEIRPLREALISGSDVSAEAVRAASKNLRNLPFGEKIGLKIMDIQHIPSLEGSLVVCNPPHGIRLRIDENITHFYKLLGNFLKQKCKGATVFLYLGNRELIPHIGLKPAWKKPLPSGGLDGRLVKFEIY